MTFDGHVQSPWEECNFSGQVTQAIVRAVHDLPVHGWVCGTALSPTEQFLLSFAVTP